MTVRTQLSLIALAALVAGAAQAAPAPAESNPTAAVTFADLDLATPAGMKTLKGRVEAAAVAVCRPAADMHDLRGLAADRACLRASVAQAMTDVSRIQAARGPASKSVQVARR